MIWNTRQEPKGKRENDIHQSRTQTNTKYTNAPQRLGLLISPMMMVSINPHLACAMQTKAPRDNSS
jgi:hypothetical protein